MKKTIYTIFAAFILSYFISGECVFATEEVTNIDNGDAVSDSTRVVSHITYDDVIEKAKAHSYDLKISDFSALIAKQGVTEARAEYYPKINASAGTEYTKNFRDNKDTTVMSVGDAFINPYTRFQTVLGVNLSYNIFDFGVRRNLLNMAKEDVEIKELETEQKYRELIVNVTDVYAKILMFKSQIESFEKTEKLEAKNVEYYTRLYNAKVASSTELNQVKVSLEATKKQINELKALLSESVAWLSFYTGDKYDPYTLKIAKFDEHNFNPFEEKPYENSLVWKLHEKILKKKGYEVTAAKRQNFPKITAYSRYYLYGSDHSSYNDNLGNIRPSNFSVGGMINVPVFDGFKNSANIKSKKLEYEQTIAERDKAIAEYETKLFVMRSNLKYLTGQLENDKKSEKELTDKANSVQRLVAKRIASPIEGNNAQIELLKQKTETIKDETAIAAIARGIEVLTGEY